MDPSEELREALLNLDDARRREALQRQTAEALLAGLRVLVMTKNPQELFLELFDVLRKPMDFESAFVLIEQDEGLYVPVTSSNPVFIDTTWRPKAMFQRVAAGQPVAVFDTALIEEWRLQPEPVMRAGQSALLFSLLTTGRKALFVCTHPSRAHFSRDHVALARRFSMLGTQALQKLESEARLADLEKKLETEVKLAELHRKLSESEKKLSRSRKIEALGLLAGGVAHDLNNILSSIVGYPELMLMDEDLRPEYKTAFQTIYDAGIRASAIVEDLLTMAKGVASNKVALNLNTVITDYLLSPEHRQLARQHPEISFNTKLEPNLLNIRASRTHVYKALTNLVLNAAEAIPSRPDGSVVLATENRYVDRPLRGYEDVRAGEYAILSVSDNGSGISECDMDRIFEPFYTRKIMGKSGTGLGLTVVWNAMQEQDGYIDLSSSHKGTVFRLYFPITRDEALEKQVRASLASLQGKGQMVLVVDDLEDQRTIACRMLTRLGYVVHAVSNGETAVEYVKEHKVDILLLDMIMDPGMNGRETYERIIAIRPGMKAVIASGYSQTEDVRKAQQVGAGRYIKKPYTLEQLGLAIKEELAD